MARITLQPERAGGPANPRRVEPRAFEQHIDGGFAHARVLATHHSGDRHGPFRIRDHEVAGIKRVLAPVQCQKIFPLRRAAHHDPALELRRVEGMQRLAELEHHEIRHVHHVVDRSQADRLDPRPQPGGTRPDLDARNPPQRIKRTRLPVLDPRERRIRAQRGFIDRRNGESRAGENRKLAGDPDVAEPVGAVRRHFEIEHHVWREQARNGGAGRRGGRQDQQALGILRQAQFLRAAQHSLALDAAQLADLDCKISCQHGPRQGQRDLVAGLVILRPANDLARMPAAVVHAAHAQPVGVRVRVGFENLGDDDVWKIRAARLDRRDLETRAREQLDECFDTAVPGDVILEPTERNFHD